MRTGLPWASLVLTLGCGSDPADVAGPGLCGGEVALEPRPAPVAPLRGSIRVRDERDTTLSDGAPRDLLRGRVTASFVRMGTTTGTPAASLPLGGGCLGLTSRPTPATDTASVAVGRLGIEGTAQGRIDVPSAGSGRFAYSGLPLLAGARTLTVEASGGTFPGFSASLDAVAPLEVLTPSPRVPAALALDAPLEVRWAPGDGDAVWIEVTPLLPPGQPVSGGQVTCRVPDDGCHAVPEAAVVFLRSSGAASFVLTVRRERVRVATLEGAEVLLESASSWRFDLVAGDP